jgi:hypothetical protein
MGCRATPEVCHLDSVLNCTLHQVFVFFQHAYFAWGAMRESPCTSPVFGPVMVPGQFVYHSCLDVSWTMGLLAPEEDRGYV